MSKHEAVDRLMALATEKRADRLPQGAPPASTRAEAGPKASSAAQTQPLLNGGENSPVPTAAARGRNFFETIRPLLPAVAGAMRLVDHGAVQAVARFLPLLGGSPPAPPPSPAPQEQEQTLRAIADTQATRRDLQALTLRMEATDDLLGRTRTQLDRVVAEQAGRENEMRSLTDRSRLLSAGLIILFMLLVAQMILLVVMFHK